MLNSRYYLSDFLDIQRKSFFQLLEKGLNDEFSKRNPITSKKKDVEVYFYPEYYKLTLPIYTPRQAILRCKSYTSKLYMPVQLTFKNSNTIRLKWAYIGNIPLMTKRGHFILNGAPRIIVNQIIRSPGIYYQEKLYERFTDKLSEKPPPSSCVAKEGVAASSLSFAPIGREPNITYKRYYADLICLRGTWLRLEIDREKDIWAQTKKGPKFPIFWFLIGMGLSEHVILNSIFEPQRVLQNLAPFTIDRKSTRKKKNDYSYVKNPPAAWKEIYSEIMLKKPSSTLEASEQGRKWLFNKFMNPRAYDLGKQGRSAFNKKLGLKIDENQLTLTPQDLLSATDYLIKVEKGLKNIDDIDHLKNRRVRTSGELIQIQIGIAVVRLEKTIREKINKKEMQFWFHGALGKEAKPPKPRVKGGSLFPLLLPEGAKARSLPREERSLPFTFDFGRGGAAPPQPLGRGFHPPTHRVKPRAKQKKNFKILPYNPKKGLGELLPQGANQGQPRDSKDTKSPKGGYTPNGVLPKLESSEATTASRGHFATQTQRGEEAKQPGARSLPGEDKQESKNQKGKITSPSYTPGVAALLPKSFSNLNNQITKSSKTLSISNLINNKSFNSALREFFGTSPLSQFMDQINPLAEITHKRRLSSMGPGGVTRDTATLEIRGIHPTHYGRICPVETPEGKNTGLVNSLTSYSRVNSVGILESPFYKVYKGMVLKKMGMFFLSAEQEETTKLAAADISVTTIGFLPNANIPVRIGEKFTKIHRKNVEYVGVSPTQMISIATSLIPFLEHDDANRALMGSNMQRQAVPLIRPERPIVGTGLESRAVSDSGHVIQSKFSGIITYVSSEKIIVRTLKNLI